MYENVHLHRSTEQKGEKEKPASPQLMKFLAIPAPGFTQAEPHVSEAPARTGITGTSLSTVLP